MSAGETVICQYNNLLDKIPRRTSQCWIGDFDEDKQIYVCGYKFVACLKDTALEIWKLIDGKLTVSQIANKLGSIYKRENQKIVLSDTVAYLIELEKAGLAAWQTRPLFEDIIIDEIF